MATGQLTQTREKLKNMGGLDRFNYYGLLT